MLEAILGQMGIGFLARILARALGSVDNDIAKKAAKALDEVQHEITNGAITIDQMQEANRHIEAMAKQDTEALQTVNESLRAEIASQDKFVRRMRPTFGYLMALTWAAQMLAVAYIMVFETHQSSTVITAVESLSAIWAVGLSVLGIYVYKRSEDKRLLR